MKHQLSVYIESQLWERMERACEQGAFRIPKSQFVRTAISNLVTDVEINEKEVEENQ
jgi:hypothetical protein